MAASQSVDSINNIPDSISSLFSQPKTLSEPALFRRGGSHYVTHSPFFAFSSPRAAVDLTLKSFHLECRSKHWEPDPDYSSYFNQWIEAAKRRNIQNLDLYLLRVPLAPSVLFSCKTLVTLKLFKVCVLTMFRWNGRFYETSLWVSGIGGFANYICSSKCRCCSRRVL